MKLRTQIVICILGLLSLLWVGDALVDYTFFYETNFWDLLIKNVPAHELYIRITQSVLVIVFGVFVFGLFQRLQRSRKQTERSERFLQSTLNALADNIAVLDEEGNILSVNESWCQFGDANGLAWDNYGVGENYLEIIEQASGGSMEGADEALEGLRNILGEQTDSFEVEYPCHSSEEERWFLIRGRSFETDAGRRIVVDHGNITERKQKGEELRSLSQKFRQLVDLNVDGMMVVGEGGEIKFANPAAADLFSEKQDGLIGKEFGFPITGEEATEIQLLDESSEERVVEVRSTGLEWEEQDAYLVSLRDITERENARRRVLRLNSLLRAIQKVNQTLVAEDDPAELLRRSCEILQQARQYQYVWTMTFEDKGEVQHAAQAGVAQAFEELILAMETDPRPECVLRALESPDTVRTIELSDHSTECPLGQVEEGGKTLIYSFPESTEVAGLLSIRLASGHEVDDKEEDLIAEVGHDLGHGLRRAKAEIQLVEAQRQVVDQERQRALSTMASGIAHDFNNALSTIRGFTDLLLQSDEKLEDKETLVQYLEHVRKAASNAGETVQRMRKFYRPREEDTFEPVQLNDVVDEAISMTRPRWKEQAQSRGADIELVSDLDEVPEIMGNESEVHELLTNLIFNAVDAMPRGGNLSISTRCEGDDVVLEVSDTGRGMTEEERWHCFDPFYTTKGEDGTGLGLSTVRGIVERHEGDILVDSEKSIGTTFRINFPTDSQALLEEPQTAFTEEIEPRNILVVEDDEKQRELMREYLQMDKHKVETAVDGRDGLQKSRQNDYDAIITDHAMPKIAGERLAGEIKNQRPDIWVIMLTGFGDMMDAASEGLKNVDVLLSKPVTVRQLRDAISRSVENSG